MTHNFHLKIVVLGTRGFPNVQGGVESHCQNLYPRLAEKGCEVTVFTRRPYVDPAADSYEGVKLVSLSCPRLKFLETFWHTLLGVLEARKLNPDILHIHAVGPALLVPLARLFGLKVVMTHHGPDYKRKKWNWAGRLVLRLGELFGVKFSNSVITISGVIAEEIDRKYGLKAVVIPNGVFIPELRAGVDILNRYGLEKGKYLLAVGRFVPEKGFHDLIKAFRSLITHDSQLITEGWKLVIAGDADHPDRYSRHLKARAAEAQGVILTGFQKGEALAQLYSHAGMFAMPSYYEGLPIALLEALSYGLSCLVSDIPANREVSLDEERYFKPGDTEGLARKIADFAGKVFDETERRGQIKMVAERYNWDDIAQRTLEIYKRTSGQVARSGL